MIPKYHDPILTLLKAKGALGVNAIATETGIPLSTVQKYLDKQQTYFKKTAERKWDLPHNVQADIKTNTLELTVGVIENSILMLQSQLDEVKESLQSTLAPIGTLKRGIANVATPVASVQPDIDKRLIQLDIDVNDNLELIQKSKNSFESEYKSLILNMDFLGIILNYGLAYVKGPFFTEVSEVMLEKSDFLSEEVIEILKEYQRNK